MKWRQTKRGQMATIASKLNAEGRNLEALDIIEEEISLNPNDPLLYVYRGRIFHSMLKFGDAERSFKTALAIDKDLVFAWNELGLLLKDLKRFKEAAECFRQSVQRKTDFNALTVLASTEMEFDVFSALQSAEKALALKPDWSEAIAIRNEAIVRIGGQAN